MLFLWLTDVQLFLLPDDNLFSKRSEFKQDVFFPFSCPYALCNQSGKMLFYPTVLLDTTRFSDRAFKTKKDVSTLFGLLEDFDLTSYYHFKRLILFK